MVAGKALFVTWAIVVPLLVYPWWAVLGVYVGFGMITSLIMATTSGINLSNVGVDSTTGQVTFSGRCSGRRARAILADARDRVARLWQCRPSEVVFTSGGTESVNLALFRQIQRFNHVCQVEAIQMEHDREQDSMVFSQTKGTEDIIKGLLPILHKYLNPTGIADGHNIRVVAPDAQR